jgi:hypothetical protein
VLCRLCLFGQTFGVMWYRRELGLVSALNVECMRDERVGNCSDLGGTMNVYRNDVGSKDD